MVFVITTILALGFLTNSQLNSFFAVDATKDESKNGQGDNTKSVLPDLALDRSVNSTLSNFSMPGVSSSEDVLSENSNISQINKTEPTITDENTAPPEENNTVPQEPTITDENVTTSEQSTTPAENVTASKQLNNTNSNTSASNGTTTSAAPV